MGGFLLLLLSSAVFEPDDCPNKDPGKASSLYWACKEIIQYCIVPVEVVTLCKKGMLFSGHVSDAQILLAGRMLRLSPFASPPALNPPCLEQVRWVTWILHCLQISGVSTSQIREMQDWTHSLWIALYKSRMAEQEACTWRCVLEPGDPLSPGSCSAHSNSHTSSHCQYCYIR